MNDQEPNELQKAKWSTPKVEEFDITETTQKVFTTGEVGGTFGPS